MLKSPKIDKNFQLKMILEIKIEETLRLQETILKDKNNPMNVSKLEDQSNNLVKKQQLMEQV